MEKKEKDGEDEEQMCFGCLLSLVVCPLGNPCPEFVPGSDLLRLGIEFLGIPFDCPNTEKRRRTTWTYAPGSVRSCLSSRRRRMEFLVGHSRFIANQSGESRPGISLI